VSQNAEATVSASSRGRATTRVNLEKRSTITRSYRLPMAVLGSGPKRSRHTGDRGSVGGKILSGLVRRSPPTRPLAQVPQFAT